MARFAAMMQGLEIRNLGNAHWPFLRSEIRRAPIIVVDNLWEYIQKYGRQTSALRPMAPPFSIYWMEYKWGRSFVGALFREVHKRYWHFQMFLFVYNVQANCVDFIGIHVTRLDPKGQVDLEDKWTRWVKVFPIEGAPANDDGFYALLEMAPAPFIFGIMLMHTKNVTRVEHLPPSKLAKRNAERGKPPMLKYHTLDIEPLKEILLKEGRIESEGLQRALHLCRGHFAFYPESGPGLFGKGIHGQFWIPAHARGTEKQGVVISDYDVILSKEPAGNG